MHNCFLLYKLKMYDGDTMEILCTAPRNLGIQEVCLESPFC